MARRLALGLVAAGAYLATFWAVSSGLPFVRPLYDGLAPPAPYRYVKPPSDLAADNEAPARAVGTLIVDKKGSRARTVTTADGQALAVFADRAIPRRGGEKEATVRITPLDPSSLPKPPGDLVITGNAYRITANFSESEQPIDIEVPATVVLRYPLHDTAMLRLDGRRWQRIAAQGAQASLQLFAETPRLGTFATAGIPEPSRQWIAYAAAAGGIVAGVVGYRAGRRRVRKRPRKHRPRRARPR